MLMQNRLFYPYLTSIIGDVSTALHFAQHDRAMSFQAIRGPRKIAFLWGIKKRDFAFGREKRIRLQAS